MSYILDLRDTFRTVIRGKRSVALNVQRLQLAGRAKELNLPAPSPQPYFIIYILDPI